MGLVLVLSLLAQAKVIGLTVGHALSARFERQIQIRRPVVRRPLPDIDTRTPSGVRLPY